MAYHRIRLERDRTLDVTIDDVMNVMGIPLVGPDVIVQLRRGLTSRVYSLNRLEESLIDLEVDNEFQKVFIIFACTTILAPNNKLEGIHDLWDLIRDGEVNVQRNWSKFVLQCLENGIRKFHSGNDIYMCGCFLFLQVSPLFQS